MNVWKHVVCVLQLVSNITQFFYYMHSDHTDIHINTHTQLSLQEQRPIRRQLQWCHDSTRQPLALLYIQKAGLIPLSMASVSTF